MIIEPPPSSELLGMKEVIPDEPMSPDEDPGKIGEKKKNTPGPRVIKHFSSSAQLSMKFQLLIKDEIAQID